MRCGLLERAQGSGEDGGALRTGWGGWETGSRSRGECFVDPVHTALSALLLLGRPSVRTCMFDGTLRLIIISHQALRSTSPIEIRQVRLTNCPKDSNHDSCFYSDPTYSFPPTF